MAVTVVFTLHPLQSFLASQRAGKEATASSSLGDEPDVTSAIAEGRDVSPRTHHGRVHVHSSSPGIGPSGAAPVSEQALLAARLRIDV